MYNHFSNEEGKNDVTNNNDHVVAATAEDVTKNLKIVKYINSSNENENNDFAAKGN